ncbi:MAG TPA: amidohydrolase family protein [Polyangia bacterium]|jgi:D-galactarolactone isomerase|nr:amidohydrolase family protein [Polyangia bacterium]
MHAFEDRYPLAPTASFKPPQAPASEYREVQQALGLSRVVVVQPSGYAFDNTATLEAMATLGPSVRGVAVVGPTVAERELVRLTEAGIRGIRYHMFRGGVLTWDTLPTMADRVHHHGWHVQLQLNGRDLPAHVDGLQRLPGDLVIDHNGKFIDPVGVDDPAFQTLLRLLDGGRCWVKLSAPYETSKDGPPRYDDVSRLARALVRANPERCLWASNWPHPNTNPQPSNAAMLDTLLDWADDDATRKRILVDNPARLYGF